MVAFPASSDSEDRKEIVIHAVPLTFPAGTFALTFAAGAFSETPTVRSERDLRVRGLIAAALAPCGLRLVAESKDEKGPDYLADYCYESNLLVRDLFYQRVDLIFTKYEDPEWSRGGLWLGAISRSTRESDTDAMLAPMIAELLREFPLCVAAASPTPAFGTVLNGSVTEPSSESPSPPDLIAP